MSQTKVCVDCQIEKPLDDFQSIKKPDKEYKINFCKKCAWQRRKKAGYPPSNKVHREKWNAYQREYKRKHYIKKKNEQAS